MEGRQLSKFKNTEKEYIYLGWKVDNYPSLKILKNNIYIPGMEGSQLSKFKNTEKTYIYLGWKVDSYPRSRNTSKPCHSTTDSNCTIPRNI